MFTKEEINKLHRIDSIDATLQDYEAFFSVFNIPLNYEDGSLKSAYEIFKEASENYQERKFREYGYSLF